MSLNFEHFSLSVLKMLATRAGIQKMVDRLTNMEDPDQIASSEAARSGSALLAFLSSNYSFNP